MEKVLFVGKGATPVAYYRCMLPAMALGADWVGVHGEPPKEITYVTGLARRPGSKNYDSFMPDLFSYEIVVLQQKVGKGWRQLIKRLREEGVTVLWEVDDYLHGLPSMKNEHDFAKHFDKAYLWECEQAMKACDGVIASTEWIAGNYSHFNKRTFVCRNGIDIKRYELTKPERPTVNIGWSGGTGHIRAVIPWFQVAAGIMRLRPNTCFVSIGQDFAMGFAQHFSEERCMAVPWAAIEQYPAAMTMFDIALAPGGIGGWWRGKSDLRWLEAGALGIPAICNPEIYPDVEDGVTGFTATSPQEVGDKLLRLVDDKDLRTQVGENVREHVRTHRSSTRAAEQWREVFTAVRS